MFLSKTKMRQAIPGVSAGICKRMEPILSVIWLARELLQGNLRPYDRPINVSFAWDLHLPLFAHIGASTLEHQPEPVDPTEQLFQSQPCATRTTCLVNLTHWNLFKDRNGVCG